MRVGTQGVEWRNGRNPRQGEPRRSARSCPVAPACVSAARGWQPVSGSPGLAPNGSGSDPDLEPVVGGFEIAARAALGHLLAEVGQHDAAAVEAAAVRDEPLEVARGSRVGLEFDPLLAKLVVSGSDRRTAIARARRALADWVVLGVETNRRLLAAVLESEEFASGRYTTELVARLPPLRPAEPPAAAWIAAARLLGEASAARAAATPGSESGPADPWAESSGWRVGA